MDNKLHIFNELIETYFLVINNLVEIARDKNIIPVRYIMLIPVLNGYIENNRLYIIQKSIITILDNKEKILNFSLNNLENDSTINLEKIKTIIDKENLNNCRDKESEFFDLIIQIKNNSLKLSSDEKHIFKSYIELMINILEKIKSIFTAI
jgi:hypothetical protein